MNANGQIPSCDMPAGNHVTAAVVVFIISDWMDVLMNNHGSLRARLKREEAIEVTLSVGILQLQAQLLVLKKKIPAWGKEMKSAKEGGVYMSALP